MKICEFMLKHNNPQVKNWNFKFTYNDEKASLDISGNTRMSNIACLRNLPIDHLDISDSGAWQEYAVADMPITELNITNTKFKSLKDILRMKTLKKLTVSKKRWSKLKAPENSDLEIIKK